MVQIELGAGYGPGHSLRLGPPYVPGPQRGVLETPHLQRQHWECRFGNVAKCPRRLRTVPGVVAEYARSRLGENWLPAALDGQHRHKYLHGETLEMGVGHENGARLECLGLHPDRHDSRDL